MLAVNLTLNRAAALAVDDLAKSSLEIRVYRTIEFNQVLLIYELLLTLLEKP